MDKKSSTRQIQRAILFFAAGAFIVIGTLIGLVSTWPLYREMKKNHERQLARAVSDKKVAVEEFLDRSKDLAMQVTSRSVVREKLEAYYAGNLSLNELTEFTQSKLRDAMDRSALIAGITRLDKQGKPFAVVGASAPQRLWVIPADGQREAEIGAPFADDGRPLLVLGAPVVDRSFQRVGTDVVLIDLSRLSLIVKNPSSLGPSEAVFLGMQTSKGPLLIFGRASSGGFKFLTPINDSLVRTALDRAFVKESGILDRVNSESEPSVVAFAPMAQTDWGLALRVDKEELYGPMWNQLFVTGIVIIISVIAGTLGMIFTIRPLTGKLMLRSEDLEEEIRDKTALLTSELSQRIRVERALRESEEKYRAIFNNAAVGISLSNREGRFITVNSGWSGMLGYTPEELDHLTFIDIIHPEDVEVSKRNFSDLMEGKVDFFRTEIRYIRKDGDSGWADLFVSSLQDLNGEGPSILGVAVDITDRKRSEQVAENLRFQLLQAQKMEAVGTLAGGIAHEFNNLLTVVSGYAELLLADKKDFDPDCEDLRQILNAAEKGADLVAELLTFSHKSERNIAHVDLNHEVIQVKKLLVGTLPKWIEIELNLHEGLNSFQADSAQIRQLIMNLALNARDAMPEGGKLTIETDNVDLLQELGCLPAGAKFGDYIRLIVSDTGIGMDKETLGRIFEPFYSTKGLAYKTGLGLAVVHGIVEQHGGYINCDSKPGHGTTYRAYFPAATASESNPGPYESRPLDGTETILVADDEEEIRNLASRFLSSRGYDVITAENGQEALEAYRRETSKISLVILDLIMPKVGGRQCLGELLKIEPTVRVIIATGYSDIENRDELIRAGAKGFVGKPFQALYLLKTVRDVLDAE